MRRISCNLILAVGLILTLGWASETFANTTDVKRPRNAGILSVQTTPDSYDVMVDGVKVGQSGVSTAAEFYLSPGVHRIEVLGPKGQTFVKEIEIRKGVKNCICLRVIEETKTRPCPYDVRVDAPSEVKEGTLIIFAAINAVAASVPLNYRWTVSDPA